MNDTDDEDPSTALVDRARWSEGSPRQAADRVVVEAPLEIRVSGVPLAVVMRTPGHDLELARGFLVSEGIVAEPHHIARVVHCTTVPTPEAEDNVVLATLVPGLDLDLERHRRRSFTSSSCGLCGKESIERVLRSFPSRPPGIARVVVDALYDLPEALSRRQHVFWSTGGIHAAGLFGTEGEAWVVREDIGRHNAVDKAIGWGTRHRWRDLASAILMVSGRISFEIVQKAVSVGIPLVAGISAPSSLAIALADTAGMTLVAFVRDRTLSVYSHPERIVAGSPT